VIRKVAAVSLVAGFLAACIIADPLPEQRSLPTRKPSILTTADPQPSLPLVQMPDAGFSVPVQLYNPTVGFQWGVFVDYDPVQNSRSKPRGTEPGRPDAPDVQVVKFSLASDVDVERCHKIEFVVALSFAFVGSHEGDSAGSDSVTWNYVPQGDYSKCATYDGGRPDGGAADAGRDGSDAAP